MAPRGWKRERVMGTRTWTKALVVMVVVVFLSTPALSEITFKEPKNGSTLTQKALHISGNATAQPSVYVEDDTAHLDAGSKVNLTLTTKPSLVMAPYIGTWTKNANNPVIDHGGTGTYNEFQTTASSVILDGATYKIWGMVLSSVAGGSSFGAWTSADGKSWNAATGSRVFNKSASPAAFDYNYIETPYVIKDGATYKMWYTGQASDLRWRIGYATSNNGVTWTRGNGGNPVLNLGNIAKFDGGGVAFPSILKEGNTYKMWYSGVIEGTNLWQIGYATSADGTTWARQNNSNPVVNFGKKGSYDDDGCYYARVVKDGPAYRMWYIGVTGKEVAYAESKDGISWGKDPNNPVLTKGGVSGAFDSTAIYALAVMKDGLKFKMWYTGDYSGIRAVGLAEADIEGMTGKYTSKPFNAQNDVTWGKLSWNWLTPSGTTGTFETRTSPDNSKWTAWLEATNNSIVPSPPNRYFQYKATIATTDSNIVGAFYNMSVEYRQVLKVEVSLDNSSWFIANGTDKWDIDVTLIEGNNTVYVKVTDTTPYPQYAAVRVLVDTTIPTGHIEINTGNVFTTNLNVYLTFSAQDLNGIKKMRIGNQANLSAVLWEPYAVNKSWTLTTGDGVKGVYVEFQDVNGLISRTYSDTIILDTTPPTATLLINDNATYAAVSEVRLTLKASDKNGISRMRVSLNSSFEGADWGAYTPSMALILPEGDGLKTVYAEFKDTAGLMTTVSDSITLDTVKPTGSLGINNGTAMTRDRRVYLSIEASDANGIKDIMVSGYPDFVDGVWEPYATSKMWTLPNSIGENSVYARFRDHAGLVSDRYPAHIFLYTRILAGSIVINNGEDLTGAPDITLTINLLDNDGQTKMMLANNAQFTGVAWVDYTKTVAWNLSTTTDGKFSVYLKFKDKYGIESDVYSDSVRVDTTPPKISISYPTDKLVWASTNGTMDVKGTASDEVSLSRVEVSVDGGQWIQMQDMKNFTLRSYITLRGSHTVKARARDTIGNTASTSLTFTWPEEIKKVKKGFIPSFEGVVLLAVLALLPILRLRKRKA